MAKKTAPAVDPMARLMALKQQKADAQATAAKQQADSDAQRLEKRLQASRKLIEQHLPEELRDVGVLFVADPCSDAKPYGKGHLCFDGHVPLQITTVRDDGTWCDGYNFSKTLYHIQIGVARICEDSTYIEKSDTLNYTSPPDIGAIMLAAEQRFKRLVGMRDKLKRTAPLHLSPVQTWFEDQLFNKTTGRTPRRILLEVEHAAIDDNHAMLEVLELARRHFKVLRCTAVPT